MTEQTPLERAARALCEDHIRNVRRHDTQLPELEMMLPGSVDYAWRDFLPQARIVLKSLWEPSEAMRLAFSDADNDGKNWRGLWQAMIDAALEQQPD